MLVARDTRPTGEALVSSALEGIVASGSRAIGDAATVRTTPQLHWQVLMRNSGQPCEESDYFTKLREGCSRLLDRMGEQLGRRRMSITPARGTNPPDITLSFPLHLSPSPSLPLSDHFQDSTRRCST